ncbi:hypothetical protein RZS08_56425, partial [Arthrospira platensis SPKY1]|nr:hypothetical protein [Arthrospira platensis SPKY1]
ENLNISGLTTLRAGGSVYLESKGLADGTGGNLFLNGTIGGTTGNPLDRLTAVAARNLTLNSTITVSEIELTAGQNLHLNGSFTAPDLIRLRGGNFNASNLD